MTKFRDAVEQYESRIREHDCSGDDDCQVPSGFYLIAVKNDDGVEEIWTGGHGAEPAMMAEAVVQAIDAIVASRDANRLQPGEEFEPLKSFMRSRDIVHTAADSVDPSGDVAHALSKFVERGDDDE